MKTVLLALLEQYADWEAAYVSTGIHMLGQGKIVVKTVSLSEEPVTSIGGIHARADYTVDSAPKDYDALLLIGGMCWREERAQKMIPLVEHCVKSGKILGGICDAAAFLASIGVLNIHRCARFGQTYGQSFVCTGGMAGDEVQGRGELSGATSYLR